MGVPVSASPALGETDPLTGVGKILHQLTGFEVCYNSADRYHYHNTLAVFTPAVTTFAVRPAASFEFRVESELQESFELICGLH